MAAYNAATPTVVASTSAPGLKSLLYSISRRGRRSLEEVVVEGSSRVLVVAEVVVEERSRAWVSVVVGSEDVEMGESDVVSSV